MQSDEHNINNIYVVYRLRGSVCPDPDLAKQNVYFFYFENNQEILRNFSESIHSRVLRSLQNFIDQIIFVLVMSIRNNKIQNFTISIYGKSTPYLLNQFVSVNSKKSGTITPSPQTQTFLKKYGKKYLLQIYRFRHFFFS